MIKTRMCLIFSSVFGLVTFAQLSALGQSTTGAAIVYANPGKLVSANGTRLNLYCMRSGSPTVVFDSGWEDWAPAWSKTDCL